MSNLSVSCPRHTLAAGASSAILAQSNGSQPRQNHHMWRDGAHSVLLVLPVAWTIWWIKDALPEVEVAPEISEKFVRTGVGILRFRPPCWGTTVHPHQQGEAASLVRQYFISNLFCISVCPASSSEEYRKEGNDPWLQLNTGFLSACDSGVYWQATLWPCWNNSIIIT